MLGLYSHPVSRRIPVWQNAMNDMIREMQGFDTALLPALGGEDLMGLNETSTQVIDDDKRFAVSLDVSHFKPEELKVHLDGNTLMIEGNQKVDEDDNYIQRSFIRKWTLPREVNLNQVVTSLSQEGHLSVEAPKLQLTDRPRVIPIQTDPGQPMKHAVAEAEK